MRRDILTVVAGNFFYNVSTVLEINGVKSIWFDRDEAGYLLLNLRMPTLADRPRAQIEQNAWLIAPDLDELVCPPHGRLVDVTYRNGDRFRIEFFNAEDSEFLSRRYGITLGWTSLDFPVTVAEIWETANGMPISLTPKSIEFATNKISGNIVEGEFLQAAIGLHLEGLDASQIFPPDF
ncbi:hypothetical protein AB0L06_30770 [Spirillospora sp. NPDC052269]